MLNSEIVTAKNFITVTLFCYHDNEIKTLTDDKGLFAPIISEFHPNQFKSLCEALELLMAENGLVVNYTEQIQTDMNTLRFDNSLFINYFCIVEASSILDLSKWLPIEKVNHSNNEELGKLLFNALELLKFRAGHTNIAINFLPKKFTVTELRIITENLLSETLNNSRFRDRLEKAELLKVIPGEKIIEGKGKPAKLFQLNPEFKGNFYPKSLTKAT